MAQTQQDYNRKSMEKRGIKNKSFSLDNDTIALLEQLARDTDQTQVQVFKSALALYAKHIQAAWKRTWKTNKAFSEQAE